MEKTQQWMVIGLVGGLISIVSLAMPWLSEMGYGVGSGWDLGTVAPAPYLLLFGGILGIIGAAVMLWKNTLGVLIPIGGILALLGWIWGIIKVHEFVEIGMGVGYGIWAGLLGSLMILGSSFGLRRSE